MLLSLNERASSGQTWLSWFLFVESINGSSKLWFYRWLSLIIVRKFPGYFLMSGCSSFGLEAKESRLGCFSGSELLFGDLSLLKSL